MTAYDGAMGIFEGMDEVKNPKIITIIGKLWFQKGNGNTYYSTTVIMDGVFVDGIKYEYGYGQQYLYDTIRILAERGLISPMAPHSSPNEWARENGVLLTYLSIPVAKKSDL